MDFLTVLMLHGFGADLFSTVMRVTTFNINLLFTELGSG